MAFKNTAASTEIKQMMRLLLEFGQLSVNELASVTGLKEQQADAIMRQAKNKGYAREDAKGRYSLNREEQPRYSLKTEKAMDLALLLCESDSRFNVNDMLKSTEEPFIVWMGSDENDYDIIYVPDGEEKRIARKIERLGGDSYIIAIVEHPAQIKELESERLAGAFYVDEEGDFHDLLQ